MAYSDSFQNGMSNWRLHLYTHIGPLTENGYPSFANNISVGIELLDATNYRDGWYRAIMGSINFMALGDTLQSASSRKAYLEAYGAEPASTLGFPTGLQIFNRSRSFIVFKNLLTIKGFTCFTEAFIDTTGVGVIECRMMISTEILDAAKDALEASFNPKATLPELGKPGLQDSQWFRRRFKTGLPRSLNPRFPFIVGSSCGLTHVSR